MSVRLRRAAAAIAVALLAGCANRSNGTAAATPSAAPTAAPTVAAAKPSAHPAPRHTMLPKPAAAAPTPTPRPSTRASAPVTPFKIAMLAPNAAPRILDVEVSSTTVTSGDVISGTVLTSSNVASVEVRVATYGVSLRKTGVGRFAMSYKIGDIPFFVKGTYPMRVIARNSRGDAVEQTLDLTLR